MSSGRRTSVARPAQYTEARRSTPTRPRELAKVATHPTGTSSPAPRRTRENATAIRSTPVSWSGTALHRGPNQLADAHRSQALLVLPVFQNRSQREVDRVLVEFTPAERGERRCPVNGLRDAGRFVQVH